MKLPDEHLLSAYLDGELSEDAKTEFESMLRADPALQAELEAMGGLSDAMKQHVKFEKELPHADFFLSQIMNQIEREEAQVEKVKEAAAAPGWMAWLSGKWLLGAAAAFAALGMVLKPWDSPSETSTRILASYVPNDQVKVQAYHSEEADASVIMLTGLPNIPDHHEIVGVTVSRSDQEGEFAQTTIYDENGKMRFVMSKDARNQPFIFDVKG